MGCGVSVVFRIETRLYTTEWVGECKTWRGKVLWGKYAHFCFDWDDLPVDETCPEYEGCTCLD